MGIKIADVLKGIKSNTNTTELYDKCFNQWIKDAGINSSIFNEDELKGMYNDYAKKHTEEFSNGFFCGTHQVMRDEIEKVMQQTNSTTNKTVTDVVKKVETTIGKVSSTAQKIEQVIGKNTTITDTINGIAGKIAGITGDVNVDVLKKVDPSGKIKDTINKVGDISKTVESVTTAAKKGDIKSVASILRGAAEKYFNIQVDKVIDDKIAEAAQKAGISVDKLKKYGIDVVREIRSIVRGTHDSIFKQAKIKEILIKEVNGELTKFFNNAVDQLTKSLNISKWEEKALKPLKKVNEITDKLVNKAQSILLTVSDKIKLAEDLANKITGKVDSVLKFADKLQNWKGLDKLGDLKKITSKLGDVTKKLGTKINSVIKTNIAPAIEKAKAVISKVTQEVQKFQETIRHYEQMITSTINKWIDQAKTWLKEQANKLSEKLTSELGHKFGVKLSF